MWPLLVGEVKRGKEMEGGSAVGILGLHLKKGDDGVAIEKRHFRTGLVASTRTSATAATSSAYFLCNHLPKVCRLGACESM